MPLKPAKASKSSGQSPTSCNVANPTASQATTDDDVPLVWEKISNKILSTINERFDKFEGDFRSLQTSVREFAARVETVECQARDHDSRLCSLEAAVTDLQKTNKALKAKVNDLEGRSRRNNIKIIGIPEGEEKGRPTEFVASLIPKLLGESHFQGPLVIDRAHRALKPRPPDGERPRIIIARVHFFQEKELILRLRRDRTLDYNGHKVYIFPDYTAEVMEERRAFSDVMHKLRELKVTHSLRFPARLRIQHNGQFKTFIDPAEAAKFVETSLRQ
ncbi:hypothetical protein M9458_002632, partial [Cirrhinus mrigala]